MDYSYTVPRNIICLTEESVETLFAIGLQDIVMGVSIFVKRPQEAMNKPKVSAFIDSNIDKIVAMKPDLVVGFSDIQKDIAKELIEKGLNVYISNQRSVGEILSYITTLCSMVGSQDRGIELVERLIGKIERAKKLASSFKRRPKVYFEEWDEPMISAIKWVSECIEICGGEDIFVESSGGILAKERFVDGESVVNANPDIVLACWCGKKVKTQSIYSREGWSNINAIKNKQVFELEPEIFLQPGPAPFLDGLDILLNIFSDWNDEHSND